MLKLTRTDFVQWSDAGHHILLILKEKKRCTGTLPKSIVSRLFFSDYNFNMKRDGHPQSLIGEQPYDRRGVNFSPVRGGVVF